MLAGFNASLWKLFIGHILFIVCALFYLAWWLVGFRPDNPPDALQTPLCRLLMTFAIVSGLAALAMVVMGFTSAETTVPCVPVLYIVLGAAVLYVIMLALTSLAFKRPVTSELLIITSWSMMEFILLSDLYGMQKFGIAETSVFCAVVAAAYAASMVCYVLYYRLPADKSYVDGMIPLITETSVMAALSLAMAL